MMAATRTTDAHDNGRFKRRQDTPMNSDAPTARPEVEMGRNTDMNPPCLALRPKDAAQALGIGERLLWSKTKDGEIPHLRIGKALVYPVDALRAWLLEQVEAGRE